MLTQVTVTKCLTVSNDTFLIVCFTFSASYSNSSFDVAVSGIVGASDQHSIDSLGEICRLLKPGGLLFLQEAATPQTNGPQEDKLISLLKMSGFVDVEKVLKIYESIFFS